MSGRPAPVVLDDLAEPRFSDEVRAILAMMAEAGAGLELAPEPLMAAASEQTGLDDFGSLDFVARLEVLCRALTEEGGLSPAGVMAQHGLLTGLLRNRLLIEDRIKRNPQIQLLAIDFSTMLFDTIAPMPTWRDYYLSHDQRPSYRYLLRILKVLQAERGGRRWVLKSPQHLEQFPALVDTFPDATFVGAG